jgi:hypothetical protein
MKPHPDGGYAGPSGQQIYTSGTIGNGSGTQGPMSTMGGFMGTLRNAMLAAKGVAVGGAVEAGGAELVSQQGHALVFITRRVDGVEPHQRLGEGNRVRCGHGVEV